MLAIQAIWVDNKGLISAEILNCTKSDLLNRKKVFDVISGLNDRGTQIRGPWVVCSMASAKDSTHIETSADLTLVIEVHQYTHVYDVSEKRHRRVFRPLDANLFDHIFRFS